MLKYIVLYCIVLHYVCIYILYYILNYILYYILLCYIIYYKYTTVLPITKETHPWLLSDLFISKHFQGPTEVQACTQIVRLFHYVLHFLHRNKCFPQHLTCWMHKLISPWVKPGLNISSRRPMSGSHLDAVVCEPRLPGHVPSSARTLSASPLTWCIMDYHGGVSRTLYSWHLPWPDQTIES